MHSRRQAPLEGGCHVPYASPELSLTPSLSPLDLAPSLALSLSVSLSLSLSLSLSSYPPVCLSTFVPILLPTSVYAVYTRHLKEQKFMRSFSLKNWSRVSCLVGCGDIGPVRGILLLLMMDTKLLSLSDVIRIRSSPLPEAIMRWFFESLCCFPCW